jgi:hypothetical protein
MFYSRMVMLVMGHYKSKPEIWKNYSVVKIIILLILVP